MVDTLHWKRTRIKRIVDSLTLPIRALFFSESSTFFLTSLRDERMCEVSKYCSGRLLDLGCGPGNIFIKKFYKGGGIGADVYPYNGIDVLVDSSALPFKDGSFDTVSLIAVGGHIPKEIRWPSFSEIYRVLRTGGRLVMTEGEIITQAIHHKIQFFFDNFRKRKNMDTIRGMKEGEEFAMSTSEIKNLLLKIFGNFERFRFQLGLNNVYVSRKERSH